MVLKRGRSQDWLISIRIEFDHDPARREKTGKVCDDVKGFVCQISQLVNG